jgi:hypothetical protein
MVNGEMVNGQVLESGASLAAMKARRAFVADNGDHSPLTIHHSPIATVGVR